MSSAHLLPLMTVEQFDELPEPKGDFTYELHFGELVTVGRPKLEHFDLQSQIRDILVRALGLRQWRIEIEMPYGLSPGYDARAADVGVMLKEKWKAARRDTGYLIGSPILVVQVQSRSNRYRKMEEDALVHLTHGAVAVWLVRHERREIVMFTRDVRAVYRAGDSIPLPPPLSIAISVDDVFLELT